MRTPVRRWLLYMFMWTLYDVTVSRSVRLRHRRKHDMQVLRSERLQAIRDDIIAKLGYSGKRLPSSGELSVEERRERIRGYRRKLTAGVNHTHSLYDDEEYAAKTYHSYTESSESPGLRTTNTTVRLQFELDIGQSSDPHLETHVHSATLTLPYTTPPGDRRTNSTTRHRAILDLYVVDPVTSQPPASRVLLSSVIVDTRRPGKVRFALKDSVQNWLESRTRRSRSPLVLEVDSEQADWQQSFNITTRHHVTSSEHESDDTASDVTPFSTDLPLLEVFTQQRHVLRMRRQKRHVKQRLCKAGDGNRRCCRYPLTVSMVELGLDWILAPRTFEAFICDGKCPHRHLQKHKFAGIQALLRLRNPAAAPRPCCSAAKLNALSIAHFDSQLYVVESVLEDMIIMECMCS